MVGMIYNEFIILPYGIKIKYTHLTVEIEDVW